MGLEVSGGEGAFVMSVFMSGKNRTFSNGVAGWVGKGSCFDIAIDVLVLGEAGLIW